MPSKPLIYIAGPYSSRPTNPNILQNVKRAIAYGERVIETGLAWALIPHLNHWFELYSQGYPESFYYEWDFALLARCDGMLVVGLSPGVRREVRFCEKHSIPVYYTLQEMIDALQENEEK